MRWEWVLYELHDMLGFRITWGALIGVVLLLLGTLVASIVALGLSASAVGFQTDAIGASRAISKRLASARTTITQASTSSASTTTSAATIQAESDEASESLWFTSATVDSTDYMTLKVGKLVGAPSSETSSMVMFHKADLQYTNREYTPIPTDTLQATYTNESSVVVTEDFSKAVPPESIRKVPYMSFLNSSDGFCLELAPAFMVETDTDTDGFIQRCGSIFKARVENYTSGGDMLAIIPVWNDSAVMVDGHGTDIFAYYGEAFTQWDADQGATLAS